MSASPHRRRARRAARRRPVVTLTLDVALQSPSPVLTNQIERMSRQVWATALIFDGSAEEIRCWYPKPVPEPPSEPTFEVEQWGAKTIFDLVDGQIVVTESSPEAC